MLIGKIKTIIQTTGQCEKETVEKDVQCETI